MKKELLILFLLMFFLSCVSASCIDINSASLEELDEIIWVGPATAQKIIDARPFDSIEDLDRVSGIGDIKVADIRDEGLACVDGEVSVEGEETEGEVKELKEEIEKEEGEPEEAIRVAKEDVGEKIVLSSESREIISLNGNVGQGFVGQELVYESKDSKIINYIPYAFSAFLIVIIGILIWKRF